MKTVFTDKVDAKDIMALERRVQECAPWEAVRNFYKELSFYLKRDDFDLFKSEFFSYQREISDRLAPLAFKKDVAKDIATLQALVQQDLEKYSKIKDCQHDKSETVRAF